MRAEYINHLGDDLTVVNAARVSFDKESEWADVIAEDAYGAPVLQKVLATSDVKLIKYLATHGHWTPFSHPQIQLRITVPIFVSRQDFKHMIGMTRNEVSRRYVDDDPIFFEFEEFRSKPENSKQGSGDNLSEELQEKWKKNQKIWNTAALVIYQEAMKDKMAPEQARAFMPQSMYTSYWTTGSLAAWARMYKQRIDSHAQLEIRQLAQQVGEIIEPLYPVSWRELTV